jgi:TonB-dependent receptor
MTINARFSRSTPAARRGLIISASAIALTLGAAAPQTLAQTQAAPAGAPSSSVIVTARKNLAGSLATKRDAVSQIEVISAEEIAQRPVANVVDAVSILPGISTYADNGLGQVTTGNPEYITIDGVDSSFNAYELNGVRVPTSDPYTRALSLKMLPPFGISQVQIDKTPTANEPGDAIGGVVNIDTPTAFDFAGPLFRVSAKGTLNDLAEQTGLNGLGGAVQLEMAQKFADDKLGVYVTGYYEKDHSTAESTDIDNYVPTYAADANKSIQSGVPLTADQFRWDFYTHAITSYGGSIALDYRTENQSFYLKATTSQYDDQSTDNQTSVRHGLANTGAVTNKASPYYGDPIDWYGNIVAPGQPGIAADAPEQVNLNPSGTSYDSNGVYDPNGVLPGHYFQLRDQVDDLTTVKVGGETRWDKLTLSYSLAYGVATDNQPNYVQASSYTLPDETGRFIINSTANGVPEISYNSPETEAFLFSQNSDALWKLQGNDAGSSETMFGGKADAVYHADDGILKTVSAGGEISDSGRTVYNHQFTAGGGDNFDILTPQGWLAPYFNPAGPTVANQPGTNISGSFFNYGGVFRVVGRSYLENLIIPYAYKTETATTPTGGTVYNPNDGAPYNANDYYGGSFGGKEDIDSAYVAADFQVGQVHLYPGLRYEYTDFNGYFWNYNAVVVGPNAFTGAFQSLHGDYGEVLPSLNVVYRPDNGFVLRASVRKAFSRPAFALLAAPAGDSYNLSNTGQEVLTGVSEGNPDLKPTQSINFDGSIEYYGVKDLFLEAHVYERQLSDFIYTANTTGSGPQNVGSINIITNGVEISKPENGNGGTLDGVSLAATDRFGFLPGLWRGLGVNVNGTFQHSEADSGMSGEGDTPLPHSPKLIYNLQLLYDLGGAHAALTWQYQGLQLDGLEGGPLNDYLQPTEKLNLNLGYDWNKWSFAFGVRNLTNSYAFFRTLGEGKQYLDYQVGGANGNFVQTGRFYQFSVSYKY